MHLLGSLHRIAEALTGMVRPGDLLLTLGGGDVTTLGRRLWRGTMG